MIQGEKERDAAVGRRVPRRWVVARDFGWLSRLRQLARDQERLTGLLKVGDLLVFCMIM